MAQLLIRNISDDVKNRLQQRADVAGHSLEAEARAILEAASSPPRPERSLADLFRHHFDGAGIQPEELIRPHIRPVRSPFERE